MAIESPLPISRRGRTVSWIVGILALVVLVSGAIWLSHASSDAGAGAGKRGGGGRRGAGANQITTVGTVKATAADLPVEVEALGTVTPAATATVRPQVSGTITQLMYREGQLVQKGQTLAIIDPRPYRAALLQAQGALIRDEAQLANVRVQLSRYRTLLGQDSIARQDVDTQAATAKQLEGTIAIDRGQVQQAQINLGFTRVIAPVTGRVGLKVVDVGNYIGAGDANGIAVVTTLQPIDVEFAIPQDQAPTIAQRVGQGADIPAIALDRTRTQTLDKGSFSTLDNRVDTTTGTIKGKARFPNGGNQLYPNQFVNVRLTVDTVHQAITIPSAAVRSSQDGSFVWLLKADHTVTQRKIVTAVTAADKVQVTKGLVLGETVVTDGGDRLSEGAKVALPGEQPAASANGRGKHRHRRGGGQGG